MKLQSSKRLRLRDVLILRVAEVSEDEEPHLAELATNLSGLCAIPIIVLQEGMSMDSVSEADMAKAGWVRVERSVERSRDG